MENKNQLLIWVAIAIVAASLVWLAISGNRVVVVDNQGRPLGAISGPDFPGPYFGINGLQEYVGSGNFKDATTTILSLTNPNTSATGSIAFMALKQTGVATSTFDLICGTGYEASAPRVGAKVPNVFFSSPDQATSTSFFDIGANATSTLIYIGPSQKFLCAVRGSGDQDALGNDGGWDSAFTNSQNTFTGSWKVKIHYSIW